MGAYEPPACIQNAMMTKDKKPFTYTPGGLDLSQIKCPSQARRFARQKSLEEHEQAYAQQHNGGGYHPQGGPAPPPPPPPQAPAPPPPPPLVIPVPHSKSPNPKPVPLGERPEIVIPENPIGMLRKTNSPYHWEAEKADQERLGPVPKFQDKTASPQNVQMAPSNFSQQPPQAYYTPSNNQQQNYPYASNTPSSPVHKPEPQYSNQRYATPVGSSPPVRDALQRQDSQFNKSPQPFAGQSPVSNGSAVSPNSWRQNDKIDSPVSDMRGPQPQQFNRNVQSSPQQPSQFNRDVQSSPQSPPQFNRHIQSSPQAPPQLNRNIQHSPQSPPQINHNYQNRAQSPPDFSRNTFSPNLQQNVYQPSSPNMKNQSPVYHTLPRTGPKPQDNYLNFAQNNGNVIQNNVNPARPQSPRVDASGNPAPWRNNQIPQSKAVPISSLYHNDQPTITQPSYTPPWKRQQDIENAQQEQNTQKGPWSQTQAQDFNNNSVQENNTPRWRPASDNRGPVSPPINQKQTQEPPRYQSSITIPVTPRKKHEEEPHKNTPHKEIVFVTQEPIYYCPDSPKPVPGFVKAQKEKTSTPPPEWCQKKLEGTKTLPRELTTPPRDTNTRIEPEWVKKSTEMQRGIRDREVLSPPRYEPPQPTWSTIPSANRKSIPKDNEPQTQNGSRVIPVHIENNTNGRQGQPQLRVNVTLQQNESPQGPYTQPTQRIMRVLSPQLVRFDDGSTQSELPSLNRNFTNQPPPPQQQQNQQNGPKTRIIPIQIEGGASDGASKR